MSLWAWLNKQLWLCLFAGLINPLVVTYALFRFRDRAPRVQRTLSLFILVCILITWVFIHDMALGIGVGHVLWIASLFLILLPANSVFPRIRDARWLAVPVILILAYLGLAHATTYRLEPPTDRDIFLYQVALQFGDANLCQKIPPYAEGSGSADRPGYQISYLQSDCYFKLANAVHDPSLCDKVRPLSKEMMDGSKYTPQSCRAYRSYSAIEIVDPHTVSRWMQQLGYTDPEIDRFDYRRNFGSRIYKEYTRLRKDAQFAIKIAGATGFSERLTPAATRAPNDLEYLYGIYAIDANDASVCDKISPNARLPWFYQKTISLRVECYHDLARNNRDPKFCQSVPASGIPASGKSDYESRETCLRDVDIQKRMLDSKMYSSPSLPPTYESFEKSLQSLGYTVDLPRPTDSDYEDYLEYLKDHDSPERAELLRRVAALK